MRDRFLVGLILVYAVVYGLLSWLRFATFHAQIDMSYYLRLVWGLGHGHPDVPLVQAPHWLGLHLEPILVPYALLGAAGVPLAPLLLLSQAMAVALLAWPAYRLGARHLGPGWPARTVAVAALIYPTVTVATLHDFHPITVALPALLGLCDALDEGRPKRALALGALALSCREDVALQLALVCMLWAWRFPQRRRAALMLGAMLGAYFFTYVLLVQPRFLPPAGSYNLHFANLGGQAAHSAPEVLRLLLSHPVKVMAHLATTERLLYPLRLLWPVALLPLLAPDLLLPALPILIINVLSDFPRVRTIEAHYATALVPFVLAAAIVGAARAQTWLRGPMRHLPLLALSGCVWLSHYHHGASPMSLRSARFSWQSFRHGPRAAEIRAALAAVPPAATVAARPGVLAHLAERPRATSPPEYDDGRPVDVHIALEPN
ncbi:MAG: DUF2079 domain-containing protein [Myxococcales bacterium]|nr:DUF2079 domain-containing protein [Myxococcota bacterium]MDW8280924.1 DUF2079 domain-containing protein [Myxococcales bacterium]